MNLHSEMNTLHNAAVSQKYLTICNELIPVEACPTIATGSGKKNVHCVEFHELPVPARVEQASSHSEKQITLTKSACSSDELRDHTNPEQIDAVVRVAENDKEKMATKIW